VREIVDHLVATAVFDIDDQSPSDETFFGSAVHHRHTDMVEDMYLSLGPKLARPPSVNDALRAAVECKQ
jgi:hypothetical protein